MAKLPLAGKGALTDAQFVRRVFIVAIVVSLLLLLWALTEILLLIFAAVLLAVLLRAIAALVAARIRADERWSLLVAAVVLFGIVAAAVFLFGSQMWAQLQALGSQLHAVEDTLTGYVERDAVRELLGNGSVGALFARALSWGTTAMAATAGLVWLSLQASIWRSAPRCTGKASSNCFRSSGMTGLVQLSTIAILPCVFGSARN
jgi:predicted PurR-regulated permease PerM